MDLELHGYDSFEKIGQGGMAAVWKARQISLDRPVAIKILTSSENANDEDIDQFQSEARIAASLNHNGIVQVYDAFYRNNLFCFVMEFVDGQTIGQWIKQRGRLTEQECLFVAKGVANALDYAWNYKKLVHCDIKPDNVMIDSDGSIKVTDLGLCRGIGAIQTRKIIREANNPDEIFVLGTPSFVSPEQALGQNDLQPQADMYSLGAMLYNMILGKFLFADQNIDNVMELQVSSQDLDIYDQLTDVSPMFCDFVERLLSKQPEERYASWGDVLIDIERISHNCPLLNGPLDLTKAVSTMQRSERRQKKHSGYSKLASLHAKEHSRLQISSQKLHKAYEDIEIQRMHKKLIKKAIGIAIGVVTLALVIGLSIGLLINKSNTPDPEITKMVIESFEDINKKHFARVISDKNALDRYNELLSYKQLEPNAIARIQKAKNDIEHNYTKKKNKILNGLKKEAEFKAITGDIHGAVSILEDYSGPMADDTHNERLEISKDLVQRYKQR